MRPQSSASFALLCFALLKVMSCFKAEKMPRSGGLDAARPS